MHENETMNPYKTPPSSSEPPGEPASGKIWVEIDKRWIDRVQSPTHMVVAVLTGVSITFAPLTLFWIGRMQLPPIYHWSIAGVCFAMIFLVPAWYMRLASEVIKYLYKNRIGRSVGYSVRQEVADILDGTEPDR